MSRLIAQIYLVLGNREFHTPATNCGKAVGGEVTGDDMIGRIPETPQRRRSKRSPKN